MRFALTLVTAPTVEPVLLAEAKTHLRVDTSDDDAYITALIATARTKIERDAQLQLITATWLAVYDAFPRFDKHAIEIPLPPLQSVASVQYLDRAGVLQTWVSTEYVVDAPAGLRAREGRLAPAVEKSYPETAVLPGAVRVQFLAGYGAAAAAVPNELKHAIKLLLSNWYEHREAVIVGAVPIPVPIAYDALILPFQRLTAALA